ncbi:sugar transferase [Clostridium perfringens]|uniref:sugar transferase n=1 Tax=Clostridium perfringens TaxID=1502 RepID=UPI0018A9A844|nr:sugar transferase [Clostridium perfringens]EGT2191084.1 sugar transferase [Clostridium perfringens]ELC8456936.1 sugar transferase [Clostridium perfringens]ELC8457892.1 sugar transferase [Clostridium perfringens]MBO3335120.1 sugar transferase [Clostridium perfringens]MDB2068709.1 sugar transferase [Clostridium perfringens]
MKRVFDFLMSFISIIVFSPIILIISLLIKLTSKGPVFFKQRRIGKNNEEFNILKFRTMRVDTPNVATHLLKDPSVFITPLGKFLRKTSLDELPQLINILKGEMSIVGPRPALYNQYDLKDMRTEVGVHKLVPGLTGWAQINGRDEIPLEEKVALDKEYMNMQSFWMDIKIIFMTVFKVAKSEGVSEGSSKGGHSKSIQNS